MINKELINPKSIVIVGGSNSIFKPGGKALKNIIDNNYKGKLFVINPKEDFVQGIKSFKNAEELPQTDVAIIGVPARFVKDNVEVLATKCGVKAFIILSAGFSETNEQGKQLEKEIVDICNKNNVCLIGPNCTGVLTHNYSGIFAGPIPKLNPKGCDFVSGSGATAAFIIEEGMSVGLTFASMYAVGNSAQNGVEEVIEYWDNNFDAEKSSHIKIIYMENIKKPKKFLKHTSSLIKKGCRIAAVKSGNSSAGSRAASSHTGALATPDVAVQALFDKAGIVRCQGREDLVTTAAVFTQPELKGKNIAIVTQAGGPGVMLTDVLSNGGLEVPHISGDNADKLLSELFNGSAVGNPIDFLATGTAEQLALCIDSVENKFDDIDGMAVIFGDPALVDVRPAYKIIHEKMKVCKKPIYPILPSITTGAERIDYFKDLGRAFFPDELSLGRAVVNIYNTSKPSADAILPDIDKSKVRKIIDNSDNGYLSPEKIQNLLDLAKIDRAKEFVVDKKEDAVEKSKSLGFPIVMKVVGPVHKTDVGGVSLNVNDVESVEKEFNRMINIKDTTGILLQPMLSGVELFIGAKYEEGFGHMILCGLGGIFIEVFKDTSAALSPVNKTEALKMIKSLKSYKIIQGVRGNEGVNEDKFADAIVKLSALLEIAPEIKELDLNPCLGTKNNVIAVDARIRIEN
ncbi:MAG: acetate--CoA ligase family protein [Bacteroidetes bacterium]|nr:acetate--CoA ligase family protein [Bacteroidota bacterium]